METTRDTQPTGPARPSPSGEAGDYAPLRALFRALNDAWTRGDAEGYASLFTDDAEYIAFDGTQLSGRAAIEAGHRSLFDGSMLGSRLVAVPTSVRILVPGVALLHGKSVVLRAGRRHASRRATTIQTLVAVDQDGRWRVAACQSTRYRPLAHTSLGGILLRLAPRGPWAAAPPATPDRRAHA